MGPKLTSGFTHPQLGACANAGGNAGTLTMEFLREIAPEGTYPVVDESGSIYYVFGEEEKKSEKK